MQEAVILAGGLGTRLQSMLSNLPKAMAPVNGRPFLEYLLDYLQVFKISRVVLSVGYHHDAIMAHFGSHYKNIKIDYAIEHEQLGTGGGIRLALKNCSSDQVLVLNGDTIFRIDPAHFFEKHVYKGPLVSIALRQVDDISRFGSVKTDQNEMITVFGEKSTEKIPGLINGGIYCLNRNFFLENTPEGNFSIERDCFEKWAGTGKLAGFMYDAYFLDMGVPDDYLRAQDEFKRFIH